MQGKLTAFEPKMQRGTNQQEVFEGRNGTLYKFNLTMLINGTTEIGEYSSNKQNPSWKINEDYTFNREVRGQQGQFIVYKELKSVNQQFNAPRSGGGKSGGIGFAKQKALECAAIAGNAFWASDNNKEHYTPEVYLSPAKDFYNELVKTGVEEDIWLNIASLNTLVSRTQLVDDVKTPTGVRRIDQWIKEMNEIRTNLFDKMLHNNGNNSNSVPR